MSVVPMFEAPPATAVAGPGLREVALAAVGFAALGACAAIGAPAAAEGLRTVPSGLMVPVGALVLTGPALVVAHQFLRLEARPEALAGALAGGFCRAGGLALGLAPTMLFFGATTTLWAVVLSAILAMTGLFGFVWTARRLDDVERTAGPVDWTRVARMQMLIAGWTGLCALVALRLAWNVAGFVAGQ